LPEEGYCCMDILEVDIKAEGQKKSEHDNNVAPIKVSYVFLLVLLFLFLCLEGVATVEETDLINPSFVH